METEEMKINFDIERSPHDRGLGSGLEACCFPARGGLGA